MKQSAATRALERLKQAAKLLERPGKQPRSILAMEVCGTHTMSIARNGLRPLFPKGVRLIPGPGCPVCVTPQKTVEECIAIARLDNVVVATFGDMVRVPGRESSLERERASGADVRIVYSPSDALDIAKRLPEKKVVFLAVGFETTAPAIASTVLAAERDGCENFFILPAIKLIPPAMEAVLEGNCAVDGFITPGHVSVIIGSTGYQPLAERYGKACVATGFEPVDILEGLAMLIEEIATGRARSVIQYKAAVHEYGNKRAQAVMYEVFEPEDAEWRGLGTIPASGLKLRSRFERFDARTAFDIDAGECPDPPGCRCGDVLKGLITPTDCPLFGNKCVPARPVGPCMVSSEGACAAYYRYGEGRSGT